MSDLFNATQQLMTASKEGDEETIKLLIEKGCDVNAIDSEGCNALMLASFNGHEKPLELLIKSGCDINAFKSDGFNALMMACEKGHYKCVELLIKYGCRVNATNSEGCNALMLASVYGHEKTLELLINSGCDVNAVKCDGFNALMLASEKGHHTSVELLVISGCVVNAVDSEGCNSLMLASIYGHDTTLMQLIKGGCDINAVKYDGFNALMLASEKGHPKCVELLIKNGCFVNAVDNEGCNALMLASIHGHDTILMQLIKSGCDINAAKYDGFNALMLAIYNGHYNATEILIKCGCQIGLQENNGDDFTLRQFQQIIFSLIKHDFNFIPNKKFYKQCNSYLLDDDTRKRDFIIDLLLKLACNEKAKDEMNKSNELMKNLINLQRSETVLISKKISSIFWHINKSLVQLHPSIDSFYHYPVPKIWKLGRQIGRGSFGEVCLLIDENNPNDEKCVVKKQNVEEAKKDKNKNLLELQILLKIEHKRIVSFYGFIFEDNYLNLIFECLKKGTLRNFVHCNHPLTENKIKHFTRQILEGLSYLHNCKPKIIHRDIKGSNILLDDEENIRLADFGLSRLITLSSAPKTDGVGTNKWMAPEVMDPNNETYDEKADIWSTGCTVVEMATKEPPFPELNNAQVIIVVAVNKVKPKYDLPENSPEELKILLKTVFKFKPDKRPSADEILNMDYFKETRP